VARTAKRQTEEMHSRERMREPRNRFIFLLRKALILDPGSLQTTDTSQSNRSSNV